MKRKAVIVLVTVLVLAGFSGILNRMSYSPDFSIMDVLSSASKKEKADTDKNLTGEVTEQTWGYTVEQLGITIENPVGGQTYVEKRIQTSKHTYDVLWNEDLSDKTPGSLQILSDETDASYKEAVQDLTEYLRQKGYGVSVIKCRGEQLLAFGHAGKFDVFLLREEAAE